MRDFRRRTLLAMTGLLLVHSAPSFASFHVMQIEKVIAGVNGDVTAQAIQFRMRGSFQNQLQFGKFVVRNASGGSPITLTPPGSPVPNEGTGVTVLYCTPSFSAYTSPPAVPNFTMTNVIPPSYFAAGTLTFESTTNVVYWRLSWGGASYTGPGTGDLTNDPDGNFNPPFAGVIPTTTLQALQFLGAPSAASTNNLADYALSAGAAVFTNNAGASFTVIPAPATQLSVDPISTPPTVNAPFNVTVRARNNMGGLASVSGNTAIQLSASGGATGSLGGTTTGQINAATDTVTIVGVTYPNAESIKITATRTSGDVLAAGESASFFVIPVCNLRGDLSGNATVDGDDIQAFVGCVTGGSALDSACACADMSASGDFSAADVSGFVDDLLGL